VLTGSISLAAAQTSPKKAPPLAVAPFDTQEAKEHQRAWAEHSGADYYT
jgi:TolB-like protein